MIVTFAGVSFILGFLLFYSLPTFNRSEGRVSLPGVRVVMAKVGPGVFFAAFGTFVLWKALDAQLTGKGDYLYYSPQPKASPAASPSDPNATIKAGFSIGILNCLEQIWPPEVAALDPERVRDAVHAAKVAVLLDVWQPG